VPIIKERKKEEERRKKGEDEETGFPVVICCLNTFTQTANSPASLTGNGEN
jgi:hypothetical protein